MGACDGVDVDGGGGGGDGGLEDDAVGWIVAEKGGGGGGGDDSSGGEGCGCGMGRLVIVMVTGGWVGGHIIQGNWDCISSELGIIGDFFHLFGVAGIL